MIISEITIAVLLFIVYAIFFILFLLNYQNDLKRVKNQESAELNAASIRHSNPKIIIVRIFHCLCIGFMISCYALKSTYSHVNLNTTTFAFSINDDYIINHKNETGKPNNVVYRYDVIEFFNYNMINRKCAENEVILYQVDNKYSIGLVYQIENNLIKVKSDLLNNDKTISETDIIGLFSKRMKGASTINYVAHTPSSYVILTGATSLLLLSIICEKKKSIKLSN